jgi:hypothetical protein
MVDFDRQGVPKLNYCRKVFFSFILIMKKLEIEKTKPSFIISVLKVEY